MSGVFGGRESASPQVVPGFEFQQNLLRDFSQALGPQLQGIFANLPNIDMSGAQGGVNQGLQALLSNLGMVGQSQQTFGEGLQTGFMPQFTQDIENQLLQSLERSFTRGDEAVRGRAADLGAFSSSGTARNTQELRTGLESNLMQQLAGLTGQGALQAQQMRGGLAGQGMQIPGQVLQGAMGALQQGINSSQFNAQLPIQGLGAVNQGVAATPLFQPTEGPSKLDSFIKTAAPIAGFAAGGPVGGKAGSAAAGKATGGSGGGGGGGGGGKGK